MPTSMELYFPILAAVLGAAIGFLLLYVVVRLAVTHAIIAARTKPVTPQGSPTPRNVGGL